MKKSCLSAPRSRGWVDGEDARADIEPVKVWKCWVWVLFFFFPGAGRVLLPQKTAKKQFRLKVGTFGFTERCQIPAPPKSRG